MWQSPSSLFIFVVVRNNTLSRINATGPSLDDGSNPILTNLRQTTFQLLGNRSVTGIFDTVDEHGRLVLITGTGPVKIPAADVYF